MAAIDRRSCSAISFCIGVGVFGLLGASPAADHLGSGIAVRARHGVRVGPSARRAAKRTGRTCHLGLDEG